MSPSALCLKHRRELADFEIDEAAKLMKLDGCPRACAHCGKGLRANTVARHLGLCSPECKNKWLDSTPIAEGGRA